ncbi:MAG: hypothetical protein Q8K62_13790 [Thiobacillus sp.]|nr:hypothetical protein [Thiobacillus sp.]
MPSIEQSVKSQFAKVFTVEDWPLFKKMAEANLREAATLLKADMTIASPFKLLARNSRKRLLIGVGIELLLKAVYLKHGYAINKTLIINSPLNFPFLVKDTNGVQLSEDKTVRLNELIEKLSLVVVPLQNKTSTLNGLRIAKVFRNKEGHGVTCTHVFDPTNYTDIASSLVDLYRDAFGEKLSVRFSLAPGEPAVWRITRPNTGVRG